MLTDRQRVEAGIIPSLIYGICQPMADLQETDEQKDAHVRVCRAALRAMMDPIEDLEPRRAGQIVRRTERLYCALADTLEGTSNAQALMAIYYLLEGLLQEERLTIYADTEFGQALETYMDALQPFFEQHRLDAAAQKRARKMRTVMQQEGYFK